MRSDYEIKVQKELKRGNWNPVKISSKTGIPVEIVRAIVENYSDFNDSSGERKIKFTKSTIVLVVDILILYLLLKLVMALLGG